MSSTLSDPGIQKFLKWMAILTAVVVVGTTAYQYIIGGSEEMDELHYRTGNLRLEDGLYQEALFEFNQLLELKPHHAPGLLGRALALKGLDRFEQALESINIALEVEPRFAVAYANRGIIHDLLGRHREALADYIQALELDPELGEGPDWITRFLRNQPEAPPTIATRAAFLEQELKKPPAKRRLRIPEEDSKQQSYKYEEVMDDPVSKP